jgi:hypothetical protein
LNGSQGTTLGVDPDVLELEAVNQALATDGSEG